MSLQTTKRCAEFKLINCKEMLDSWKNGYQKESRTGNKIWKLRKHVRLNNLSLTLLKLRSTTSSHRQNWRKHKTKFISVSLTLKKTCCRKELSQKLQRKFRTWLLHKLLMVIPGSQIQSVLEQLGNQHLKRHSMKKT